VCVITKLGLGDISLGHAVDDFLLVYIETYVWVCNQLDYQTNLGYMDLFHLLTLKYFFQIITNFKFDSILTSKPLTA
jgi:hypothetical protein